MMDSSLSFDLEQWIFNMGLDSRCNYSSSRVNNAETLNVSSCKDKVRYVSKITDAAITRGVRNESHYADEAYKQTIISITITGT